MHFCPHHWIFPSEPQYNNMALRPAGKSPWFGFAALWGRKLERDLQVSPVSSSWAPPKRTKVTNLGPLLEKDAILLTLRSCYVISPVFSPQLWGLQVDG